MYAPSHTSVPFRISGSLPAGFDRVVYSLSAPTSSTVRSVSVKAGSFSEVERTLEGDRHHQGHERRGAQHPHGVGPVRRPGDRDRRRQGDARQDHPGVECVDDSYSAWSTLEDLTINRSRVRASAFKP